MSQLRAKKFCSVMSVLMLLVGCRSRPSEQTIVSGDKFEITFTELEQILRVAPRVAKEQVKPARRAILDALIDQKLLAEAGAKQGVDERPEVFQEVEAAKRAILANAYIKELTASPPQFSASQVQAYYVRHPWQFSDRVKYIIREYELESPGPAKAAIYSNLLDRGGLSALAAQLADEGSTTLPRQVQRFSSDMGPLGQNLNSRVSVGSKVAYQTANILHLGTVEAIEPAPLSLSEAAGDVKRALLSDWQSETVRLEIASLRQSRHVQIVKPDLKQGAE